MHNSRKVVWLSAFSPLIWLALMILFDIIFKQPISAKAETLLREEANKLIPPLGNSAVEEYPVSDHDESYAYSYMIITTAETEEDIFSYYDSQLKSQNWVFLEEVRWEYGAENVYCKDNFSARIINRRYFKYEISFEAGSVSYKCPYVFNEFLLLREFTQFGFLLGCSSTWIVSALIVGKLAWGHTPEQFRVSAEKLKLLQVKYVGVFGRKLVPMTRDFGAFISVVQVLACLLGIYFSLYKIVMFILALYGISL